MHVIEDVAMTEKADTALAKYLALNDHIQAVLVMYQESMAAAQKPEAASARAHEAAGGTAANATNAKTMIMMSPTTTSSLSRKHKCTKISITSISIDREQTQEVYAHHER